MRSVLLLVLATSLGCSFSGTSGDPAGSSDGGDGDGDGDGDADAASPISWWDTSYALRRPILVVADDDDVPAGASVAVSIDTGAFIGRGELLASGLDLRVVRLDGDQWIELDRWIDDGEGDGLGGADTRVWFRVQQLVPAQSTDSNTFLYYANATETTDPLADMMAVFVFGDDFEGDTSRWAGNGRGESFQLQSGVVHAGQAALELLPGTTSAGGVHRDQVLPEVPLRYTKYLRQAQSGASLGSLRLFQTDYAGRNAGWLESAMQAHSELDSGGALQFAFQDPFEVVDWAASFGVDQWRRIDYIHDASNETLSASLDGGGFQAAARSYDGDNSPILSFALEGEGQGSQARFYVDNFIIRFHLALEPMVSLASQQTQ